MTDLDIDARTDPGRTPWFLDGNFGPVFDEVTDVREDKPITAMATTVTNQDGAVVLDGTALTWTEPISRS